MTILTGGCQCGAIRFRAESLLDNAHVCHCRMCQKAVGGFFAALVGVPESDLTWTRAAPATFESSPGIDRGFCPRCGTPMFYHARAGGHVSMCIATFDAPDLIPIMAEYGTEARLPQIDQLGHVPAEPTEPAFAARSMAASRQHPDYEVFDDPEDYPV